jgi:hypothetical protein
MPRYDWITTPAFTGTFIRTPDENILARLCSGKIYLFDRHNKEEYCILINEALRIAPPE